MSEYAALPLKSVNGMLTFDVDAPERAVLDTPALALLTDLAHGPRVSVYPDDRIDDAIELMKRAGVRMAFVVTTAGSATTPIGIVTAADLLGPIVLVTKLMAVAFIMFWVRFTYPRLREDQLQAVAWKYLIPIALANVIVTAVLKVAF